ncbi:receptor-interacting serine/threonine-protein kinase 4-like [Conger conger]|uniref:receptor-interacting serine/threonine-protein kinase 4-like n=1 Tax=Conger conger TaxID=82655 RepID=UPI002A5AAD7A|nr:receptor-interacting serine/threonine-protein kinase 4-like [Conger conger]
MDKGKGAVRIMFFDFSSAFNTIQPARLRDKLVQMGVDTHLVSWIRDYLTGRTQFVRLKDCFSEQVVSSTGAPQGTVLSAVLFTLYTSDFRYNSESCHMQKFSDDPAIVGCIRDGQEDEYRNLVDDFVQWCNLNHMQLDISKTKEIVVDFRRTKPPMLPVSIEGVNVEVKFLLKYTKVQHFGLIEDCKLQDWSVLGSGGFGQIYKAKHKDFGMEVAIKLLHYDNGSSASLLKEAEFMRQGGSPYMVCFFGVYRGVPPGRGHSRQMGLVMELMERGSVESLLKRLGGPPPWPLAFRLAHQVALGMNFLHKLCPPLLHLDLKPSNVLLDHGFGAKITDFGLARLMRSISSVGGRGEDGGTLSYMSPEALATDRAYKATPASDSYSYAILLWSIITGREPYGDAALDRIQSRVPEGDRPSLEGVNRAAVEGLGEIIDLMERCWDPSPQKRPSFHDCLPVTEKGFELHSRGIHDAIHQVSKALDEKREISPTPIPNAGVTVDPRGGWNSKDGTPPNFRAADSGVGTEPCPASATSKALSDSISKTSSISKRSPLL